MNDSPIIRTSLPATPLDSQVEGPPVVPPAELLASFVPPSVLEAPPPLVLLGPIVFEPPPVVFPPAPVLLALLLATLVTDAVVIPSPPVVGPLDVVELAAPKLVLVTVLETDAVVLVLVFPRVPVGPIVPSSGSVLSALSLLHAASAAHSAKAAPQRRWRIIVGWWGISKSPAHR
ncbi:MAG TPA: hypothetical protein VI197_04710 [Polyangiaceae bacterium]